MSATAATSAGRLRVLLGAAFLMDTSAIGPGFLTQTVEFTDQLGASFGFAILVSVLFDLSAQLTIWRVIVAARMPGQVTHAIMKERSERLLALSEEGALRFSMRFVEREMAVLWEQVMVVSESGFHNTGLTDNYLRVGMIAPVALTHTITLARLTALTDRGVYFITELIGVAVGLPPGDLGVDRHFVDATVLLRELKLYE